MKCYARTAQEPNTVSMTSFLSHDPSLYTSTINLPLGEKKDITQSNALSLPVRISFPSHAAMIERNKYIRCLLLIFRQWNPTTQSNIYINTDFVNSEKRINPLSKIFTNYYELQIKMLISNRKQHFIEDRCLSL